VRILITRILTRSWRLHTKFLSKKSQIKCDERIREC